LINPCLLVPSRRRVPRVLDRRTRCLEQMASERGALLRRHIAVAWPLEFVEKLESAGQHTAQSRYNIS